MTSTYDEIFSHFLGSVTDYDLWNLEPSDAYAEMTGYLHKAMAETYVNRLFQSYTLSDDVQTLEYDMIRAVGDDQDKEFVETALAKWMVYEWLQHRVRSVDLISQMFAGKEAKFYSQKEQLTGVRGLMDEAYKEARFYVCDRGYIHNSYLES